MREKIIVAMSGGVDSSVAAALLLEKGYDVIGVNLRTWEYEAPRCDTTKKSCCSQEDIRDAREVGLKLNIPFYVIKMEKLFGEKVINRFISDYQNGMTPNPCVECNTFVKFGALFEKAKALGIHKIATGHYAKIVNIQGRYAIANAQDSKKNQAYYLYGLSQENLANTIFPLGDMEKLEVREHAKRFGLSVAEKKESQEICFIPENDYRKFLEKKNISFTPGYFKLRNGIIVGKHKGKENFTIGQRKGLGISWSTPLYVVEIQDDGTVILGTEQETVCESFEVEKMNFQGIPELQEGAEILCKVQVRYRHKSAFCKLSMKNGRYFVYMEEIVHSVTPGQSAVFYPVDGSYLLCGGIIKKGSVRTKQLTLEQELASI
jgi:tRNA-specific 2-thiouridylase